MSVAEVGVHFLRKGEGGSREGRGMAVPLLARQSSRGVRPAGSSGGNPHQLGNTHTVYASVKVHRVVGVNKSVSFAWRAPS